MEKERKDQQTKLGTQEKKWDFLLRALHREEIPNRQEEYSLWKVRDLDDWETFQTERVQTAE